MKILSMASAAVVVLAISTFAAAADNKKLLVGKWEAVKGDEGTLPAGSVIEFTADGKMKLTLKKDGKDATLEGAYTVDGDSLAYEMIDGDAIHASKITIKKISETELDTVNPQKKNASYKRVK